MGQGWGQCARYHAGKLLRRPRREDVLKPLPRDSVGAQIGVFKGEFTAHILRVVRPRELHLIDAWWLLYGNHYPSGGPTRSSERSEREMRSSRPS